ncbi:NusG domain II-containing protein [Paraliobacillus salinarum]|uniref:NusG domain II-containing protein n=1 Tax=Paraliobacillus salinarum TaxID=1158996 RepID=UPI0015F37719|nr:NusG domain II-containing protein [Paraliobacillus salinarum]
MRKVLRVLKPFDIVIIALLIAISFIPLTVFSMTKATEAGDEVVAVIIQDGEVIREITLTGHEENEQFIIEGKGNQYNLMEVDNEQIRIKEDNSPDQVGVKMGWKGKPGETIICLPHKLLVEIQSKSNENIDDEIISY